MRKNLWSCSKTIKKYSALKKFYEEIKKKVNVVLGIWFENNRKTQHVFGLKTVEADKICKRHQSFGAFLDKIKELKKSDYKTRLLATPFVVIEFGF